MPRTIFKNQKLHLYTSCFIIIFPPVVLQCKLNLYIFGGGEGFVLEGIDVPSLVLGVLHVQVLLAQNNNGQTSYIIMIIE